MNNRVYLRLDDELREVELLLLREDVLSLLLVVLDSFSPEYPEELSDLTELLRLEEEDTLEPASLFRVCSGSERTLERDDELLRLTCPEFEEREDSDRRLSVATGFDS